MEIKKFEIHFFQVGEGSRGGDAIFIRLYDECNNPKVIVIDGGYQTNGQQIADYMKELGLNTIDLMVNTHRDRDHISGLTELIGNTDIKVNKLIANFSWNADFDKDDFCDGRITDNSLDRRLIDLDDNARGLKQAAEEKGIEIVWASVGTTYFDCLTILGPDKDFYKENLLHTDLTPELETGQKTFAAVPKYDEEEYSGLEEIEWFDDETTSPINETSIIMSLQLPGSLVLFTGDAGKEALTRALDYADRNGIKGFTHMQLPHHGSRKNVSPEVLERIGAHTYYVSCPPRGIEVGHYSRRLVNKVLQMYPEAKIYTTKTGSHIFYHGLTIGGVPAMPLGVFNRMDGKQ